MSRNEGKVMNKLDEESIKDLNDKLKKSHNLDEKDRIRVILARNEGYKIKLISHLLRLSLKTVFNYLKDWENERKTKNDIKLGKKSNLSKKQEEKLIQHLEETTYLYVKHIANFVEREFGVKYEISGLTKWLKNHEFVYKRPKKIPGKLDPKKQEEFIKAYEELKTNISENDEIYFADATHPEYQSQAVCGWIKKGVEKTLATTTSQQRLHFAGAISLKNMHFVAKEYITINKSNIVDFFKYLESSTQANKIHVICDNGTSYKNKDVEQYLKTSRIKIHYLPTYSPNLNPIERLWKILKENVCYNKYYENFSKFSNEVRNFLFEKIPKIQLKQRINDSFQKLHINPIRLSEQFLK
jgi:transposase